MMIVIQSLWKRALTLSISRGLRVRECLAAAYLRYAVPLWLIQALLTILNLRSVGAKTCLPVLLPLVPIVPSALAVDSPGDPRTFYYDYSQWLPSAIALDRVEECGCCPKDVSPGTAVAACEVNQKHSRSSSREKRLGQREPGDIDTSIPAHVRLHAP